MRHSYDVYDLTHRFAKLLLLELDSHFLIPLWLCCQGAAFDAGCWRALSGRLVFHATSVCCCRNGCDSTLHEAEGYQGINNNNRNEASASTQTNQEEQKQKSCPRKTAIVWASIAAIVVAGAVVGGVCGDGSCGGGNSVRTQTITDFINLHSYTVGLFLSSTGPLPEEQALQWLINDDQLNVGVEDDEFRLLQRYSLLTFWFQAPDAKTAWRDSTNWLNEDECSWAGIGCELGVVTVVDNLSNGLQGSLSPDLALLSDLTWLNLYFNNMSGSLPSEIGLWTSLTSFDCSFNSISGSLSSEMGLWTNLEVLNLGYNRLTGSLPSEIGMWTSLTLFDCSFNSLTGTIPETIANWKLIDNAYFDKNNFVGSMPDGICEFISELSYDCALDCSCCTSCT